MRVRSSGGILILGLLGVAAAACSGTVRVDGDDLGEGGSGGGSTTTGAGYLPDAVEAACPDLSAEPLACLAIGAGAPGQLLALSPTTGALCPVTDLSLPVADPAPTSLAVIEGDVYYCDDDRGLVRASLTTGEATAAPYACYSVTAWQGKLLVTPLWSDDTLELFPSFDDVLAGAPEAVFAAPNDNSRMAASGDALYSTPYVTAEVQRWQLPAAEPLPPVALEGFEDWVDGMWVSDDATQLLVLSFTPSPNRLATFDLATGALVASVPVTATGGLTGGLHCWTKP